MEKNNITTEVGLTLTRWDEKLLLCEKVDQHGNMVKVNWNKGRNANKTKQQMQSYGEEQVLENYV